MSGGFLQRLREAKRAWQARWATWQWERRLRYLGLWARGRAWWENRHVSYRLLTDAEIRARRRSGTIFLIGSGPSVTRLAPAQWATVARADSCGINYSFLLPHVPTFQIVEDPKTPEGRAVFIRQLAPRRAALSRTVWVMHRKQLRRLIHPRYAPSFFPESPEVWTFDQPATIVLDRDRPFMAEDFARAIVYRGTMSVALWFALWLGYRRIVMLGVDLQTHEHFYDGMPEMRPQVRELERLMEQLRRRHGRRAIGYPAMVGEPGKYRPFDEYLYALNELYCRPRGVELFVANADNMLCPRIPCFDEW